MRSINFLLTYLLTYISIIVELLWPPCVADADIIFSSCSSFFFLLFSSPNLSGRKVNVFHGVALVQIYIYIFGSSCP